MSLSPARQHRLRVQAEQAAREGGSVRHASGYDLMLLQLAKTAAVSRAFSPR
ncbi:small terminase subunit [Escherichia coli]|nr:small terminase subunit [Escherichia coli]